LLKLLKNAANHVADTRGSFQYSATKCVQKQDNQATGQTLISFPVA